MDTEELPSLSDTLRYVACVDSVPGFGKNIDIYFEDNDKLPRALTCGLLLTVPYYVNVEKMNSVFSMVEHSYEIKR